MGYGLAILKFFLSALRSIKNTLTPFPYVSWLSGHTVSWPTEIFKLFFSPNQIWLPTTELYASKHMIKCNIMRMQPI